MFGQPRGRKIPQKPKARNKLVYGVVIAVLVAVALISGRMRTRQIRSVVRSDAPFQIHVIDVGQGDSILLLADGHAMLLDAGTPDAGRVVTEYLDLLGITELEYAAASHLHADHIGGFPAALKNRKVLHCVQPETPEQLLPEDAVYQSYTRVFRDVQTLHDGDSFTLGSANIQVLAPAETDVKDLNNTSLVFRVTYADTVCLFTGDMEAEEEQALLERHPELKADFLKIAHHGSASSTGGAFLQAVQPDFAAISCGKDNGHPAPETLERLQTAGASVGITAEQGHLAYIYENGRLQCYPQKPEGQS